MTAEPGIDLDGLREVPAWMPDAGQLADLELLLSGAFAPLTGFMNRRDTAAVRADGRLADGTPWPEPITLTVPDDLSEEKRLVLQNPEGVPVALLTVTESWRDHATAPWRLAGPVTPLRAPAHGPFLRWRRRPDEIRAELASTPDPAPSGSSARPERAPVLAPATAAPGAAAATATTAEPSVPAAATEHVAAGTAAAGTDAAGTACAIPRPAATPEPERAPQPVPAGPVLAVTTRTPLHRRRLGQIRHAAERLAARLLVLPLVGGEQPLALTRAVLAARAELPADSLIVTVPLRPRADPTRELLLRAHIAATYGATHLLADEPAEGTTDAPIPVLAPEPWAYDTAVEVWRPASRIDPDNALPEPGAKWLAELLDRGEEIPDWLTPPAVARELRAARPPRHERGLTVFFTGLSGSGKSTIARALADALVERGGRTVTLLDGDVVRRMLSAGLTFSKSDRDLNIRRIGFVAAEIGRHGGVAICAPIAPYAATRQEVRRMVSAVADFVLVHVNTPLEECERRDHKGLYAKARAGLIPSFTGVSDPYEEPTDADLTIDTSLLGPQDALEAVLTLLTDGGWIRDDGV
jgi:sulfate adenylyltransferase